MNPNRIDELIAFAHNGGEFRGYAATRLLEEISLKPDLKWEICYHLLISTMTRQDWDACRKFLLDWCQPHSKPAILVTRFQPGNHWHVLDTKYSTLDAARHHLEQKGYRFAGTQVVYAPKEGD
jgi:hypothetical protein